MTDAIAGISSAGNCNIIQGYSESASMITINTGFNPKCILYHWGNDYNGLYEYGFMINIKADTILRLYAIRASSTASHISEVMGYVNFHSSSVELQVTIYLHYIILG